MSPARRPAGRRELPGGVPFEICAEVSVYTRQDDGRFFAGALLVNGTRRAIEVTAKDEDRLYRISEASPFLGGIVRARGKPLGFAELDEVLSAYAADPENFAKRAEREAGVDFIEAMPRAAVLARWGPRAARIVKRL
jgi:hypothetical protein